MDAQIIICSCARFRTEGGATVPPGVIRKRARPRSPRRGGEAVRGLELVADNGAGPAPHAQEGPVEAGD